MKNKLIIYEGIDCCGKSTEIEKTYNDLIAKGYKVIKTREPGGTPLGEKIRDILKSDIKLSYKDEAYLFATSRSSHNAQIIEWIKEGYIVLCDRHYLSSYVYQGSDLAEPINKAAMEILDNIDYKIIYFDVDQENYTKRVTSRNEKSDRFEYNLADPDYFNETRIRYVKAAMKFNAELIETSNKNIEDIHKEVMDKVLNIIEEE